MKKIILLFIISGVFVSCSKKTPSGYFPLKIGNKWEYSLVVSSGTNSNTSKMTYTVMDTVPADGGKYYKFKSDFTSAEGTNTSTEFYRETPEGIVIGNPDAKGQKDLIVLPAVIEPGKVWEAPIPGGKRTYKILPFEDLTISDKTFKNCVRIDYEETMGERKNSGFYYFAKNTGLVKFVIKNDIGNGAIGTSEANMTSFSE